MNFGHPFAGNGTELTTPTLTNAIEITGSVDMFSANGGLTRCHNPHPIAGGD